MPVNFAKIILRKRNRIIIPALVIVSLLVAVLLYSSHQEIKQNEEETDELYEERIKSEIESLKLKKMRLAKEVARDIKVDLIWMAKEYKKLFNKPFPACKQCSELEYLLILEMATKAKNPSIKKQRNDLYNLKKGKKIIDNELENAEFDYEKRFNIPIPWWWVCSDEERLIRLKNALETGTPYPDYSNITYDNKGLVRYELGRSIAEYEMRFKRQPPECHCSEQGRLESLRRALETSTPYLTIDEESDLRAKLETEYQNRFGNQISDLELLTTNVYFCISGGTVGAILYSISIMRTSTGAVVKGTRGDQPAININIVEWLDFVNTFYKLIGKWEQHYPSRKSTLSRTQWDLSIFFLDKDNKLKYFGFSGGNTFPTNWSEFVEMMESMENFRGETR